MSQLPRLDAEIAARQKERRDLEDRLANAQALQAAAHALPAQTATYELPQNPGAPVQVVLPESPEVLAEKLKDAEKAIAALAAEREQAARFEAEFAKATEQQAMSAIEAERAGALAADEKRRADEALLFKAVELGREEKELQQWIQAQSNPPLDPAPGPAPAPPELHGVVGACNPEPLTYVHEAKPAGLEVIAVVGAVAVTQAAIDAAERVTSAVKQAGEAALEAIRGKEEAQAQSQAVAERQAAEEKERAEAQRAAKEALAKEFAVKEENLEKSIAERQKAFDERHDRLNTDPALLNGYQERLNEQFEAERKALAEERERRERELEQQREREREAERRIEAMRER